MAFDFKKVLPGKSWVLPLGAGIAAFAFVLLLFFAIRPATKYTNFLIVKEGRTLTRGQALSDDVVGSIALPASAALAKRAIPDTSLARASIKDVRVSRDLGAGHLLLFQDFAENSLGIADRVDPERRALSIPVSAATAVAHMIEPGSVVDVIAVVEDAPPQAEVNRAAPSREPVARTILQGVRVLAVGTSVSKSPYVNSAERGYTTVTLELMPDEVARAVLALSMSRGGLILSLRHPKATLKGDPVPDVGPGALRSTSPTRR